MMPMELSAAIPQLPSGDIEVTAAFFKEDLGFEIVSLMKEHKFLIVRRGPAEIHFWQAESKEEALQIGSASSCYIRVKNITVLFEEFKSRKTRFRYELQKMPWGMYEMQIDDPFGNAIRFGEVIN
nr:VOC family protein [Bacteriovorax sp. HI3]